MSTDLETISTKINVAKAFGQILHSWIGADTIESIITENKRRNDLTCASHDHCDSNQAMLDAFESVTGIEAEPVNDKHRNCMNDAWTIAKDHNFFISTQQGKHPMPKFTRPQLKEIREAMQQALTSASIPNVKIIVGNCSFLDGEATYKITVLLDGAKTREQKQLEIMLPKLNLSIDSTNIHEPDCKLIGYNSRARTRPWIYERNGQRYGCNDANAVILFGK